MANKILQARTTQKIDTSENWAKAINFVPLNGEFIIYSDTKQIKVGDGVTTVNDLEFCITEATYEDIDKWISLSDTTSVVGEAVVGTAIVGI